MLATLHSPTKAILHFDGSCSPINPNGLTVAAFVLNLDNGQTFRDSKVVALPGQGGTNNIAEFHGLILGLTAALNLRVSELQVYGDSNLVVAIVNNCWKARKPHLQALRDQAQDLIAQFHSVQINWIPRDQNTDADAECEYLSRRKPTPITTRVLN